MARAIDSIHWFINELTSRLIAESGNPTDRFHLGKMIFQSLKDNPDFVMQIDGATGESDTNALILEKSIRCAICFKNLGLKRGDVMNLIAPNYVDIAAPYYAALYLGVIISGVDITLGIKEIEHVFRINKPKIIFCQTEKAFEVEQALKETSPEARIITFGKGSAYCSFSDFLIKYSSENGITNFKPADFDPEDTIALLTATSGTTGLPKSGALTHKNLAISVPYVWSVFAKFPNPTRLMLMLSPIQWLTAGFCYLFSPILGFTRLQSSKSISKEHTYELINTYKPTSAICSVIMLTSLFKSHDRNRCDFSSLEVIVTGGSPVPHDLFDEIKKVSPGTKTVIIYGLSEVGGLATYNEHAIDPKSLGTMRGHFEHRLINIDTQEDIHEPNVPGELWLKGPTVFKEYYNNPEATADTFTEDHWFKTGDILYRDEHWNFYFVERLKLLLKYDSNQVSPAELEHVIREHPGVLDAAVTGLPDPTHGDLPVACVVRRSGSNVTAQEIKDLVKNSLSDSKQLRGGVIFMEELPKTVTFKVCRKTLNAMVLQMERQ